MTIRPVAVGLHGGHGVRGLVVAALCVAAVTVGGCASGSKSSRMRLDDYDHIAAEIAAKLRDKLATSDEFARRTADSPPMVITITKVRNEMTAEMLSEATKWYLMAKLKSALPLATLSHEKNMVFTVSAEHLRAARRRGTVDEGFAAERAPTHDMVATFKSVVRSSGMDRTDAYFCEFELLDLGTGEVVWDDAVEFKRTAHGRSWD